jgi:hypothetical protein
MNDKYAHNSFKNTSSITTVFGEVHSRILKFLLDHA